MASIQQPSTSDQQSASNRNIFEDPAIQQAARDDAFVRFISKHWLTTVFTLAAIALVMIAYNIFTTTAEQKRAQATASLRDIQESYNALVDKQVELQGLERSLSKATNDSEKKEATAKIESASQEVSQSREKVSLMIAALDPSPPFDTLGNLYKGLVAGRFKDYDTVRSTLVNNSWEKVGKEGTSERFIGEVATLGLAKSLAESDKDRDMAKESLRSLAERGGFVAPEAVAALSLLVTTPEEKARVKQLVLDLKSRLPTQARYLGEIAERL